MERHLAQDVDVERRWAPGASLLLSVVVAVLVLVSGSAFALCTPAGAGLDEPMHVARVWQLAHGVVLPQEVDPEGLDASLVSPSSDRYVAYGGQTDAALYELVATGNRAYYGDADREPFSFPTWEDERFQLGGNLGEGEVTWLFPNTAINSPVSYAPHVLACWVSSALTSDPYAVVIAMRLAGVIVLSLATFGCMRLLPMGGRVFALVALLPLTVSVNSMVTADLMTFVCASVYFSCVMRMLWDGRAGRPVWGLLWASLLCLCLAKVTYAPFGLLLFLLPASDGAWRTRGSLVRIGVVGVTSLAAFVAWYLVIHDVNTGLMWSADIDPDAQVAFVAANPLVFLTALVKGIGNTDILGLSTSTAVSGIFSAAWMTVVPLVLIVACDLLEGARLRPHGGRAALFSVGTLLTCSLIVVLVYLALYLQFTPPGEAAVKGIQKRYFLPIILPFILGLLVLCGACCRVDAPRDVEAPSGDIVAMRRSARWSDILIGTILALYTATSVYALAATLF